MRFNNNFSMIKKMLGKEPDQDPIKTFYSQLQGPLLP